MSKKYVLVEISYMYNDEYYYKESDSGVPVKVFNKLEDAEKEKTKRNKKMNAQLRDDGVLSSYVGEDGGDMEPDEVPDQDFYHIFPVND